jgi:hypothetical protein
MTQSAGPDKKYLSALPVFFANLDPSGIPTGEDLATDAVARAVYAINGLHALGKYPPECGVDLWPRLWIWIEFLYSYREYLPRAPMESDICFDLLYLINHLGADETVAKMIENTRGVRTLVTRGWALLFELKEKSDHPGYSTLCDFLSLHMKASDPLNLEEIFDGAGGPTGLAVLIVQYLRFFIPDQRARLSMPILHMLDGPLELLADLDDKGGPIIRALLSAGIVPALTTVAYAIGEAQLSGTGHLLLALFASLVDKFLPSPSYIPISQALASGLLCATVRCAHMPEADEQTVVWHMLLVTLPASTVYCSVVAQLPAALLDAKDLTETPTFRALPIYRHWQAFYSLAQERIRFMQDMTSIVSYKACDNMQANKRRSVSEF